MEYSQFVPFARWKTCGRSANSSLYEWLLLIPGKYKTLIPQEHTGNYGLYPAFQIKFDLVLSKSSL